MRAIVTAVLLTATAAGIAACGGDGEPATVTAERQAADPKRAIVHVEGVYGDRRTSASGVIFDAKEGLALTANHAIEAAPAVLVKMSDGTLMRGQPIARAQCHDFAVLRLDPRPRRVTPIPFGESTEIGVGDPVTTLSYQLESAGTGDPALTSVRGSITAIGVRATFTPLPTMEPLIAHQSPLTASASGSPLLDSNGRMVGINTLVAHPRESGAKGVEYAVTSDYVRRRLAELRPGRAGALGGWEAEHDACHAALRRLIGAGHVEHE